MQTELATCGAGCFWGVEIAFRLIPGVIDALAGYSGGTMPNPTYEDVCSDRTGHAEVVQVTFDPSRVSYDTLLDVFFTSHDPTQLNRQGPDSGTQYRSAIFTTSDEQARVARAYIAQLDGAKVFGSPIVTQVVALPAFYDAEAYHQNYAALHPHEPYIAFNDLPKVDHLRTQFPDLYRGK
jgi:peptide-methionine (S)-S-oxide reductase